MSKVVEEDSSLGERPGNHRPRRLAELINPMGTQKVHSLVDKIYKIKNFELAWRKVKQNKGAGGVENESLEEFEKNLGENLGQLHEELKTDDCQPLPVKQKLEYVQP